MSQPIKIRVTTLLLSGLVVIAAVVGWTFYLVPALADSRYRAAFGEFVQAKQTLEDLATPAWQEQALGSRATQAEAADAAARHLEACDEVSPRGVAVRRAIAQLDALGATLRAPAKQDLSRELVRAATAYLGAYQSSLEDFCDRALDAVVVLLSPRRGDDVNALRRAASDVLLEERKRADAPASQIQSAWQKLDGTLLRGFGK